jgi:hypothetical protein
VEVIRDVSAFDAMEIHGMVDIDEDSCEVNDDQPEFFSLFVHHKSGEGLECIGDFADLLDATHMGSKMSALIGWPLNVCCVDIIDPAFELPMAS